MNIYILLITIILIPILSCSDSAQDYIDQGYQRVLEGDYQGAIVAFDKAIERDPKNVQTYIDRGVMNFTLGQHEDAVEDYNKAEKIDPTEVTIYFNRANSYYALENYSQAISDYTKAIELSKDDSIHRYAHYYSRRAHAKIHIGDYEGAIEDFNKYDQLVGHEVTQTSGYLNIGVYFGYIDDHERAIEFYTKAIEIDPENMSSYFGRASNYLNIYKFKEALLDSNKAIELEPAYYALYSFRANVYNRLNKHEKAIEDYSKSIEIFPSYYAYEERAWIHRELGNYDNAIDDFTKAMVLDHINPDPYIFRGWAKLRSGDREGALEDYNKAAELLPDISQNVDAHKLGLKLGVSK